MKVLVTGGSGFIGSALVRYLLDNTPHQVINLDKLTYAANPKALLGYEKHPNYVFIKGDICDRELLETTFETHKPDWVVHLAAESHVDKSIYAPAEFINTNIVGTYHILEQCLAYWHVLKKSKQQQFRFLHISTDEVFGDLSPEENPFDESSPYNPSSPYSASKASSDHLVRAWHRTYQLPVLITNCSNNYGPYQNDEKLIPKMIKNGIEGKPLPIYGNGQQVRDWLHVKDHAEALVCVLEKGKIGETYCIGGNREVRNLDLVHIICKKLDLLIPENAPHQKLITYVNDREGHDFRYAINTNKVTRLSWYQKRDLDTTIEKLILFYYKHNDSE
ncbi:dTDP-glucose 4,6-dehydratase [Vibrio sp. AK197]